MLTQYVATATAERDRLEAKYAEFLTERPDMAKSVTYVANKNEPVFGWFRFKEGFSRRLIQEVVAGKWALPPGSLIFDPFAGCGTTLLACQQLGYAALGTDIMPISVFVTRVKLHKDYDTRQLETAIAELLASSYEPTGKSWPKVRIIDLAFSEGTQDKVLFYRDRIQDFTDPWVRDFLMLGLLSSLEEASHTSKDGQFLRLVERPPKPIEQVLAARLQRMLMDLWAQQTMHALEQQHPVRGEVFLSDARCLSHEVREYRGQAAGIVTSPPYLNRYDYSRTYALELCLLYDETGQPCVKSFEDLKGIRHRLLRSHIESRPAPTDLVNLPALDEILRGLQPKQLNNPRIPIMIEGYFEDMNLAIREMAEMLGPGGRVALVVANARFEGEMIPVDLFLSELAASHGMETTEIWVTRYKGNSSQQMGRYGRMPVRESIVFWKKADGRAA